MSVNSLTAARDLFLPAIRLAEAEAVGKGVEIVRAEIWTDMVTDEIHLGVTHRLCCRYDLENRNFSIIGKKIRKAMMIDAIPVAQSIAHDRRVLLARADRVKKTKAKPVRAKR